MLPLILYYILLFFQNIAINLCFVSIAALEKLKTKPLVIKEGVLYKVRIRFRVQHEIITGLRYLQLVKRKGLKVDKSDEVCVHD